MTLIISAVTSKKIYQVTDTRLTLPNGDVFNDFSIKTTIVCCSNAFISISYTGIAFLDNLRMDEWLVKILTDFHAWEKNLLEVAEHIKSAATIEFKKINNQKKHHTFVLAGWVDNPKGKAPTTGLITNCEDENFKFLAVPLDHFEIRSLTLKKEANLNKCHGVCINGTEPAIKERYFRKQLNKFYFNKLNNDSDGNDVVKDLVKLIRIAASHKKYGKYINKYCVSVYFEVGKQQANSFYHNLDNKKISYMPNLITNKGLAFWGFEANFTGDPIGPVQRKNPFS